MEFVNAATPTSLEGTKQVLSERQLIEVKCANISQDIQLGLARCDEIRQQVHIFKSMKKDADLNQNFTFSVTVPVVERCELPAGQHTTTCLKCNRTCHDNCALANDDAKAGCCAMTGPYESTTKNEKRFCGVCPGKCHWTQHTNVPYVLKWSTEEQTRTNDDMKKMYAAKLKGATDKTSVINAMAESFEEIQVRVLHDTKAVRDGL